MRLKSPRHQIRGTGPLARLRVRRKMCQRVAAERAGISEVYLRLIESGKQRPSFRVIERIATAWGYPAEVVARAIARIPYAPLQKRAA